MAVHWDLIKVVKIFLKYKPNLDSETKNTVIFIFNE